MTEGAPGPQLCCPSPARVTFLVSVSGTGPDGAGVGSHCAFLGSLGNRCNLDFVYITSHGSHARIPGERGVVPLGLWPWPVARMQAPGMCTRVHLSSSRTSSPDRPLCPPHVEKSALRVRKARWKFLGLPGIMKYITEDTAACRAPTCPFISGSLVLTQARSHVQDSRLKGGVKVGPSPDRCLPTWPPRPLQSNRGEARTPSLGLLQTTCPRGGKGPGRVSVCLSPNRQAGPGQVSPREPRVLPGAFREDPSPRICSVRPSQEIHRGPSPEPVAPSTVLSSCG